MKNCNCTHVTLTHSTPARIEQNPDLSCTDPGTQWLKEVYEGLHTCAFHGSIPEQIDAVSPEAMEYGVCLSDLWDGSCLSDLHDRTYRGPNADLSEAELLVSKCAHAYLCAKYIRLCVIWGHSHRVHSQLPVSLLRLGLTLMSHNINTTQLVVAT